MNKNLVIMGVAGCGKSSLGAALAELTGARLVEGDDFHSPASREKMQQGIALTDADRDGWLTTLARMLAAAEGPVVLTCSALKLAYRDRLRSANPGLGFVFLEIDQVAALARVQARSASHFFSASLVDSQFATLESPQGEPNVLCLDALAPIAALVVQASAWLQREVAA